MLMKGMVDTEICYSGRQWTKPVNMWSTFLNRAIRGYILVVDAPHVVLMEAFAFNVMGATFAVHRGCFKY